MKEQEKFWSGEFGDSYHNRNIDNVVDNFNMFRNIFNENEKIESVIEFGAGKGYNLTALNKIFKNAEFTAIEINYNAFIDLLQTKIIKNIINISVLEYRSEIKYDLVLTKGFLIHISPKDRNKIYKKIYDSSKKYILLCEYYNKTNQEILYHGNKDKCWKNDFAGDMLRIYKNLKLKDYGFVYHKDKYPQDDLTWFLLEK